VAPQQYSYKVKIINPKKSEIVCFHLHGFTSRFVSVTAMRVTLVDEVGDHLPETTDFNVGYYGGKQQSKIWLVSKEDLDMMYSHCKASDIIIWCDGRETRPKRKGSSTNRQKRLMKCLKHCNRSMEIAMIFLD